MMVDGRHAKNAFAAQLERTDLQNHRHRFDNENPAYKKEQNLLLDNHRNDAQRSSKRERTNVAHEHFSGVRVVPQKSQRRADQRPTQDRQLSDARDVLNLKIGSPAIVATHVGQNRQCPGGDYRASDRQAVEPVREIHGIGGAGNHHRDENQKRHKSQRPEMRRMQQRVDHQVRMHTLQKRDHQFRGVCAARGKRQQPNAYNGADKDLRQKLPLAAEAKILLLRDLGVVVHESDGRERQKGEQGQQHKTVSKVSPQQCRHHRRQHDQHAAHRRCAGLFLVVLRAFFANVLADLQFAQLADQPRPENKRQKHRGETGVHRANGDVPEYIKWAEIFLQDVVEKVVEHLVPHLLRALELWRVNGEQALDDALHLHAARAFHQQQVSGSNKLSEKLRGLFGRRKNFSLRGQYARGYGAFHKVRGVALNADDPINFSGFGRKLAGFTMKLCRHRA